MGDWVGDDRRDSRCSGDSPGTLCKVGNETEVPSEVGSDATSETSEVSGVATGGVASDAWRRLGAIAALRKGSGGRQVRRAPIARRGCGFVVLGAILDRMGEVLFDEWSVSTRTLCSGHEKSSVLHARAYHCV